MSCDHYVGNNPNLVAYGLTITGQVRKANEDSCGYLSVANGELFVVCDGMGGHVGGATASRIAVNQIIEHFKAAKYDDIYQALNDALVRANTQILGEAAANPSLKGMGTTACIVLVDGPDAYIAHVGDSRIYLYEAARQRLFRITKDHSLVQALVDQGQLDDRDAEHHPQKNVIMKALGTKEDVVPEVYRSPVQPATGDMFLICSDGLSGMVDDNGIEAILSSGATVEQKVQQLVDNANMPGKGLDNITVQLIQVTNSPYPASNHPDHNPRWRNEPQVTARVMADYSQGHSSEAYFNAQPKPRKRMKSGILALIIVGGALLMLGGGVGLYYVWNSMSFNTEKLKTELEAKRMDLEKTKSDISVINDRSSAAYNKAHADSIKLEKDIKELEERLNGSRDSKDGNSFFERLLKKRPAKKEEATSTAKADNQGAGNQSASDGKTISAMQDEANGKSNEETTKEKQSQAESKEAHGEKGSEK